MDIGRVGLALSPAFHIHRPHGHTQTMTKTHTEQLKEKDAEFLCHKLFLKPHTNKWLIEAIRLTRQKVESECCFTSCHNKADIGLGNNINSGKILMCSECNVRYNTHLEARERLSRVDERQKTLDDARRKVKKVIEAIPHNGNYMPEFAIGTIRDMLMEALGE